jgi:hypothetical protein
MFGFTINFTESLCLHLSAAKLQKNAVSAKKANLRGYRTIFFKLKRNLNLNNEWREGGFWLDE